MLLSAKLGPATTHLRNDNLRPCRSTRYRIKYIEQNADYSRILSFDSSSNVSHGGTRDACLARNAAHACTRESRLVRTARKTGGRRCQRDGARSGRRGRKRRRRMSRRKRAKGGPLSEATVRTRRGIASHTGPSAGTRPDRDRNSSGPSLGPGTADPCSRDRDNDRREPHTRLAHVRAARAVNTNRVFSSSALPPSSCSCRCRRCRQSPSRLSVSFSWDSATSRRRLLARSRSMTCAFCLSSFPPPPPHPFPSSALVFLSASFLFVAPPPSRATLPPTRFSFSERDNGAGREQPSDCESERETDEFSYDLASHVLLLETLERHLPR